LDLTVDVGDHGALAALAVKLLRDRVFGEVKSPLRVLKITQTLVDAGVARLPAGRRSASGRADEPQFGAVNVNVVKSART